MVVYMTLTAMTNISTVQLDKPLCPRCEDEAVPTVTVTSGKWERQFFECGCGQALVTNWQNTHDGHSAGEAVRLFTASEAA